MNTYHKRLVEVLSVGGYFVLVYLCMLIVNTGDYDWMLEPGDSICNLPQDPDDIRDVTAPLFLFLMGTPLLIALIRDIIFKDVFKTILYGFGLVVFVAYWWWSFWGQCSS